MGKSLGRYLVGVDVGGTRRLIGGREAFVWLLEFSSTTAVDLPRHRYGVGM